MATVSSGILGDGNLLNLKPIAVSQVRSEITGFFVSGETIRHYEGWRWTKRKILLKQLMMYCGKD